MRKSGSEAVGKRQGCVEETLCRGDAVQGCTVVGKRQGCVEEKLCRANGCYYLFTAALHGCYRHDLYP